MTSKILRSGGTQITGIKSVIYTEKVNAGTNLRPGCVASAYIDVEVFGSQSAAPGADEALTYYQVDSEGNETLVGIFYAEPSVPSRNTYKFTAYDAVSKLDKPYSERLNAIQANFPMSVYDLVSDACSVAGVTLGSSSWPLSTQSVEAFYADGLTCRNILQYAAEIAGRFVRCNTSGEVIFDWYTTASTGITPGTTTGNVPFKQGGLTYDNFTVMSVDAVAIKPAGTEGAAYIYPTSYGTVSATDPNGDGNVILQNLVVTDDGNGNLYLSVGAEDDNGNVEITQSASASNTLILSGNLLLTNATEQTYTAAAQNVYQVMSSLPAYRHAVVQLFNFLNPFRAGQFVSITDAQGVSFTAPIFEMRVQASGAEIKSSGKQSYEDIDQTTVAKTLANLANNIVQIDKLKVNWADIDTAVIQTVQAANITMTGSLESANYEKGYDGVYSQSGMAIDFAEKTIRSENFAIDDEGNAYIQGGEIAGFEVVYESTGQETEHYMTLDSCTASYTPSQTGYSFTILGDGTMIMTDVPTGYYSTTRLLRVTPMVWLDYDNPAVYGTAVVLVQYLSNGTVINTDSVVLATPKTGSSNPKYQIIQMSDAMLKRCDAVRVQATLTQWLRFGVAYYYDNRVAAFRRGTTSPAGSANSIYVGTQGISLGEDVLFEPDGSGHLKTLELGQISDVGAILTALTADSGWIDLSPVFYRKFGNTVFVSCHAQYSSALTGQTWTTIATLPDGFRPSRRIDAAGAFGANAEIVGAVRIESSGNIDVYPSAAVASPYIAFSASYPV